MENEGYIDLPQNFNDKIQKYKESPSMKRERPNLRVRSKRNFGRGSFLSPTRPLQEAIPINKMKRCCPLLTGDKVSEIKASNKNNPDEAKIAYLPNDLIEDLYRRGLVHSNTEVPKIKELIKKIKESEAKGKIKISDSVKDA